MCESCGPDKPERVDPQLLEQLRQNMERHARDRGMTVDQMLKSFEGPRQQRFLIGPPRFLRR